MRVRLLSLALVALLVGCGHPAASATALGGPPAGPSVAGTSAGASAGSSAAASVAPSAAVPPSAAAPKVAFSAGNPAGHAAVPADGQAVDTSRPSRVVGDGSAASCTSAAVVAAVAAGGVITFRCGPAPVTITMTATAKVRNTVSTVVLDGGGLVTLSGGGKRRILYLNTCDKAQTWATGHCTDQATPQLTVQNLTFADGNATGETTDGGGGGAIFDRGGRLRVVNSVFLRNKCDTTGPDLGGAAVRALDQSRQQPVYVVHSTFSDGTCSNGGALSSIGVSWVVLNSVLSHNTAVGHGANPARSGTPGGGSGGAVYCDGNTFTVRIAGSVVSDNDAKEGGGAVFFVSNDRTGTMSIDGSQLLRNPSHGFETPGFKGIYFLGARNPTVSGSTLR